MILVADWPRGQASHDQAKWQANMIINEGPSDLGKPTVYDFNDFASLFSAYVEWMKQSNKKHSLRWIAKRLGLSSHSFLLRLASGEKAPTQEMLEKIARLFELSLDEYAYVKLLVGYANARTPEEKDFFSQKIRGIRKNASDFVIEMATFEAISQWYHLVVLEMLSLPNFNEDPQWISARLGGVPSPEDVAVSIERLLQLKILRRGEDHKLVRASDNIMTPHNIPNVAIRRFHREMLARAARTLDEVPVGQRIFLSHTFPFSIAKLKEAEDLMIEFRARFQRLMESSPADEVYHLGLHFIPVTCSPGAEHP